jgi:hypothetical protein
MTDLVASLRAEAEQRIAAMRAACEAARIAHARAALARHMLTTARKNLGRSRAEAIAAVVDEWLFAWALTRAEVPDIAAGMDAVTDAFCAHAEAPSPATDTTLRAAWESLEFACAAHGATLADRMAWRSMCAHGWWADVAPAPPAKAAPIAPGPRRRFGRRAACPTVFSVVADPTESRMSFPDADVI